MNTQTNQDTIGRENMNINWYYIPSTFLFDGQEKDLKPEKTREKAGHVVFPNQVVLDISAHKEVV